MCIYGDVFRRIKTASVSTVINNEGYGKKYGEEGSTLGAEIVELGIGLKSTMVQTLVENK